MKYKTGEVFLAHCTGGMAYHYKLSTDADRGRLRYIFQVQKIPVVLQFFRMNELCFKQRLEWRKGYEIAKFGAIQKSKEAPALSLLFTKLSRAQAGYCSSEKWLEICTLVKTKSTIGTSVLKQWPSPSPRSPTRMSRPFQSLIPTVGVYILRHFELGGGWVPRETGCGDLKSTDRR